MNSSASAPPTAPGALDILLAVAAVLALILAFVAHKGLAVVFAATALGALALTVWRVRRLPAVDRWFAVLFAVFLAWAAASGGWSIDPRASWTLWPRLFAEMAGGLLLLAAIAACTRHPLPLVRKALIAGFFLLAALLAVDAATDRVVIGSLRALAGVGMTDAVNKATASVLVLLLWPAVLALDRGRARALAIFVPFAALPLVYVLGSQASTIGLAVGIVVAVAVLLAPRVVPLALAALAFAATVAMPFLVRAFLSPVQVAEWVSKSELTAFHRIAIWNYATEKIFERPLLGSGLNTARRFGGDEPGIVRFVETIDPATINEDLREWLESAHAFDVMPLHPHNASLQLWLELGAVGAIIGGLVLAALLVAIWRLRASGFEAAALSALVASGTVMSNLAYGIWQSWWIGALWLAAAMAMAVRGRAQQTPGAAQGLWHRHGNAVTMNHQDRR